jgi:hypothetical protein
MSFAMTTGQIQNRTKTVTRRFGWWFLKPGDRVQAVKKAMGLKKGERIERLAIIEIVSVATEPLNAITKDNCVKEGFPDFEPADFVKMLVKHYGVKPQEIINRIEFRYL